jgi:hypothetical protein
MEYTDFLKITLSLQKQARVLDALHKHGVDLYDVVDPYHEMISLLIKQIYGEQGLDWFQWFCGENDFGTNGLEAHDADGTPICFSHESLWEYLQKNHLQIIKVNEDSTS